jgi:N-Acetylglucosaminyltransferase-IV (GnT-IV) conserved region
MVLGVPTVKREVQTYLLTTLHNLVQNLDADEQSKTLIIVFVAETDLEYVETVAKEIEMQSVSNFYIVDLFSVVFLLQIFASRGSRTDRGHLSPIILLPRPYKSDPQLG